jgi:hypothetical protein
MFKEVHQEQLEASKKIMQVEVDSDLLMLATQILETRVQISQ